MPPCWAGCRFRKRKKRRRCSSPRTMPENGTRHAHDRPDYEDHPTTKASHCAKMIADGIIKIRRPERHAVRFSLIWGHTSRATGGTSIEIKRKLTEDYGIPARSESIQGVQDRQGAEGGDRRHERRDGACAVRLYLYARNGCERPETVCGYPSSRYAVATVRLATA